MISSRLRVPISHAIRMKTPVQSTMSRFMSIAPNSDPISFHKYIEEARPTLKPPVANRMIYNEQIQVMIVGGPNQRKDFHINEGEEIFYQLEGDMELKIIECGKHKTIRIPEGHMFVLPSRIPHSPQRFENTIGMVIERLRHKKESDGLRYFVGDSTDILYEEYFHCKDLGSELVPVIERFFASDASRTNIPAPGMPVANPPVTVDSKTAITAAPFNFSTFIKQLNDKSNSKAMLTEGAVRGSEFSMNAALGSYAGVLQKKRIGAATDTFLWQMAGSSEIKTEVDGKEKVVKLDKGEINLVMTSDAISVTQSDDDACLLSFTTNAFDNGNF